MAEEGRGWFMVRVAVLEEEQGCGKEGSQIWQIWQI